MNILFLHRDFPGQFKYLAPAFAMNPNNVVMFITTSETLQIKGVNKLLYKIEETKYDIPSDLKGFQDMIFHGQAVKSILLAMKNKGIRPDVIIGFSWGPPMFVKDIFPDVPFLCYFEWFGRAENTVFDFGRTPLTFNERVNVKCHNTHVLLDLCSCDAGISPTHWQKKQFPVEFHDKIKVIHDGIDTETHKPDIEANFLIEDKGLVLSTKDEVITYATRGMEPYRGFPQFMEAAEILLKKRPNARIVIAGADAVCYGQKLNEGSYKELMLKKLDLDMDRVHFVGMLPPARYKQLLQISSAHVYLTYPFILSWSVMEAMSTGCRIVASNTSPVQEVIQDNYNGILVDFFNVNQIAEKVEYILDNKEIADKISINARKTIVENYALKDLLLKQVDYILSLLKKK